MSLTTVLLRTTLTRTIKSHKQPFTIQNYVNLFTPDSTKSKIDTFSVTNWVKFEKQTALSVMYCATAFKGMVTFQHSVHRIKHYKISYHPRFHYGSQRFKDPLHYLNILETLNKDWSHFTSTVEKRPTTCPPTHPSPNKRIEPLNPQYQITNSLFLSPYILSSISMEKKPTYLEGIIYHRYYNEKFHEDHSWEETPG